MVLVVVVVAAGVAAVAVVVVVVVVGLPKVDLVVDHKVSQFRTYHDEDTVVVEVAVVAAVVSYQEYYLCNRTMEVPLLFVFWQKQIFKRIEIKKTKKRTCSLIVLSRIHQLLLLMLLRQ